MEVYWSLTFLFRQLLFDFLIPEKSGLLYHNFSLIDCHRKTRDVLKLSNRIFPRQSLKLVDQILFSSSEVEIVVPKVPIRNSS